MRRYEREHPGELIHIDIKKLGRFNRVDIASPVIAGQSNSPLGILHVCVEDVFRFPMPSSREVSAGERYRLPEAAVIYYAKLASAFSASYRQRIATNLAPSPSLQAARSQAHPTRPYTPKPMQASASSKLHSAMAYAKPISAQSSCAELPLWLHRYNCTVPMQYLQTPITTPYHNVSPP